MSRIARAHRSRVVAPLTAAVLLVLAACGSSESDGASGVAEAAPAATATEVTEATATTDEMTGDEMTGDDTAGDDMAGDDMAGDDMAGDDMAGDDMAGDDTAEEIALAPWQTMTITDVDGVAFTLADFVGTPVFVETFATWCPKCREQLQATNAAAQQLGDGAVFIALSVETGLSDDEVAQYAADNGFDAVRFAVMTPEALAAFVDGLGQSAANPPSTPKVVIDAMGSAGELTTGFESADDIVAKVTGQA